MKKLFAMVLCLVMVMGVMTACSKSSDKDIVGTWRADVKLSEFMDVDDLGEMADYLDVDKLELTAIMEFKADGEYIMTMDSKSVDKLVDVMCDGMEKYMQDMSKELGMSYEDMLTMMGCDSLEAFLEDSGALEEFDALKEMSETGEYEWKDGILYMDGDKTDAKVDGNTITIKEDGTTMVFKRDK